MIHVERKEVKEVEEYKMEVKILEKNENEVVLELSNTDETEVNTLRRLIISEVPTMAIEEVEFVKNDSALFDEILAHRLGLIPLTTDLKVFNERDKCKCEGKGCPLCQVEFTLNAKGKITVYSSKLESKDEKTKPVFGNIPVVKLLDNQELEVVAVAILGRGKQHMKFAPGVAYYHHKPILKITNDTRKLEQFKDKYPKSVIVDGKLDEKALLKDNLYESCEGVCDDLLKVDYEKNKFIFYVESFGQLKPMEMITVALEKFNEKIDDFVDALKEQKKSTKK